MIDHGKVRSTVKPEAKVIDEYSVWINTEIQEVEVNFEDNIHTEYEFNQIRYSKNEYIEMIDNRNAQLESQVTDTQLALVEVYEMML